MVKKVRKEVPMEISPSTACYHVGEDARARLRYQYLWQDYEELLKESEAKKKKLQETKHRKLRLLAEVKFLRRKYNSLLGNPSQTTLHRLKKQVHKTPSPSAGIIQPARLQVPDGVTLKVKNHSADQAAKPSTFKLLDLNQISLPDGEEMEDFQTHTERLKPEMEDFQTHTERLKPEMLKRCLVNGEPNDQKFMICRDVGNNSNRVGKRKITWQDQVALKV